MKMKISKLFKWSAYSKVGMGFPPTPILAPQFDLFPPSGESKT